MKQSKFTEEQIAFALRQADLGTPVAEVCRKMGICEATYFRWKQKYGGLGPSELRKMRQLSGASTCCCNGRGGWSTINGYAVCTEKRD